MRIAKEFRFEAAHRLPRHSGKCRRQHGHSYVLWVEVEGRVDMFADLCPGCGVGRDRDGDCATCARIDDDAAALLLAHVRAEASSQGMVMDFSKLKSIVSEAVIDKVDHRDLNEVVLSTWACKVDPGVHNVTTAEVLCWVFASAIRMRLPHGIGLERVRLYETVTSYAEWDSVHCTEDEYGAFFDVSQFEMKE